MLAATSAAPAVGSISGVCVICSCQTDRGLRVKDCVSGNFTGWSRLFAGNCMCPECAFLFSDQTFRKRSWVASLSGFRTFKNDKAAQVFFSPPDPPFFIHIAKQGQRQTWLACLHRVAANRNRYFFSHESYDVPILFDRARAEDYHRRALLALERGLAKTELLSGQAKPKTWRRALEEGWADFLREVSGLKNDLLWSVMVDVARAGKPDN